VVSGVYGDVEMGVGDCCAHCDRQSNVVDDVVIARYCGAFDRYVER
jgi:hypothetical protein